MEFRFYSLEEIAEFVRECPAVQPNVPIATEPVVGSISAADFASALAEIVRLHNCKIMAIKLYRQHTGASLKVAKDAIEGASRQ
jgi:ribosomal protein L7/L12